MIGATFGNSECWIVAEEAPAALVGFVLATKPGSGLASDPPDSPAIGMLAVPPGSQGRGLGGGLLTGATAALARNGHERSVLHVLADHYATVHLYEKSGWRPLGEPFQHSLLGRASQTYVLDLDLPVSDSRTAKGGPTAPGEQSCAVWRSLAAFCDRFVSLGGDDDDA